MRLTVAAKSDYFLTADSGPGEENKTGLIVPRFGTKPEQHVSVILSWRQLNELLLTTVEHYRAWLAAKYASEWATVHAQRASGRDRVRGEQGERRIPRRQPRHRNLRLPLHLHRKRLLSRLDLQVPLAVFMAVEMASPARVTGRCFDGIILLSTPVSKDEQRLSWKFRQGVEPMKYCPYCGASLVGGAASFCAECGKRSPPDRGAPIETEA